MDETTEIRPTSSRAIIWSIVAGIIAAFFVGALAGAVTQNLWIGIGLAAIVLAISALWAWRAHRAGGDYGTTDPEPRPEDRDALNTSRQWLVRGGGASGGGAGPV